MNNRYALRGQLSSNFENILSLPIENPVAFKVEAASIDYTWHTFSVSDNNLYISVDGAAAVTVSIDTNEYYLDFTQLASDLQALIRTATSENFLVTWNIDNNLRLTVTPPDGITFQFIIGNNSAYERLGFWDNTGIYSYASPLTGSNMPSLQRTHNIWVASDIGSTTYSANGRTDIICRIPVTANFGNTLHYSDNGNSYLPISAGYIPSIHFSLLDDFGNQIETNHIDLELNFIYDEKRLN